MNILEVKKAIGQVFTEVYFDWELSLFSRCLLASAASDFVLI